MYIFILHMEGVMASVGFTFDLKSIIGWFSYQLLGV
jgi:hypothetical protein